MANPPLPIHTSPKTDSQLRQILDRLQQTQETLVADLGALEDRFLRTGTADGAVSAGDVLYASSDGGVDRAQAAIAAVRATAIGVALNSAGVGEEVVYLTHGAVVLTGPLTPGFIYYLSAVTPGAIVSTPDADAGEYVVPVGRAVTETELIFSPLTSVLL